MERLHDACGVLGIYTPSKNVELVDYLIRALSALQHRGQESAGIVVYDEEQRIVRSVGMGQVHEVFADGGSKLPATSCGIGHVRYSTTGSSCIENAGPCVVGEERIGHTRIAVAHNGNLVNVASLRKQFPLDSLLTTTDSEVIALMLLQAEGTTLRERMITAIPQLRGAYSLVMLADGKLHGMRDPWGMRPLCIGRLGECWIIASETCALDRLGATFISDIKPGEFVTIDEEGLHRDILMQAPRQSLCVFEYIYFADAKSWINRMSVYEAREAMGRELARMFPADADYVVPVPDTSIPSALGYTAVTGIPYEHAIIKKPASERTFIKPGRLQRQMALEQKFYLSETKIRGARLVIVDDSIVRGTTMKYLIAALRKCGAKEIHLRSSAPPLRHACHFGVDIPHETELIASGHTVQEVADYLEVDSLGYLSLAGLGRALKTLHMSEDDLFSARSAVDFLHTRFCYGCMDQQGWPFDPQKPVRSLRDVESCDSADTVLVKEGELRH